MILTKDQAESVYHSMCVLQRMGGRMVRAVLPNTYYVILVDVDLHGRVHVMHGPNNVEVHNSDAAFAAAYDLT